VAAFGEEPVESYFDIQDRTLPVYTGNGESVVIPQGVTHIRNSEFYNYSRLTWVSIPHSVVSIGDLAFEGCTGLISVNIPPSVTYIGYLAFSGCSGLKAIKVHPKNRQYKDIDGVLFTKDGKTHLFCTWD
jgi:hypothetical protein